MSVWRRKAIECMPENRTEFQDRGTSIYQVFIELLPATVAAHKAKDLNRLEKYYAFAEWCSLQNDKDLWNSAGVAFYEHLGHYPETLAAMPDWVKRSRYHQIRELLQERLTEQQMQELDKSYK